MIEERHVRLLLFVCGLVLGYFVLPQGCPACVSPERSLALAETVKPFDCPPTTLCPPPETTLPTVEETSTTTTSTTLRDGCRRVCYEELRLAWMLRSPDSSSCFQDGYQAGARACLRTLRLPTLKEMRDS